VRAALKDIFLYLIALITEREELFGNLRGKRSLATYSTNGRIILKWII
jgi:hypothetical protein